MEGTATATNGGAGDVYIAVMGITGSGKSSFISRCTGDESIVGHHLQSETKDVSSVMVEYKGRKVYLVDTPGFDDSQRSDADVFKTICFYLIKAYNRKPPLLLSGIIYLHPITNVRMKGTDKTNLSLLLALCGKESLSSLVLATTMWDNVDPQTGDKRQAALIENYWKGMIDAGSTVFKHADTRSSALAIVDHILEQDLRITLKIQQELSSNIDLPDTEAGREINRKINQERETAEKRLASRRAELEEAEMRGKDEDAQEIREEEIKWLSELQKKEVELQNLKLNQDMLLEQRKQELQKQEAAFEVQRKLDESKLDDLKQQLELEKAMQQKQAAVPITFDQMSLKTQDEQMRMKAEEHELRMQSMREAHKREMEEARRHNEMLKWSKIGAVAGVGGATLAAGSIIEAGLQNGCDVQ